MVILSIHMNPQALFGYGITTKNAIWGVASITANSSAERRSACPPARLHSDAPRDLVKW
jgi:hypothetical protein